MFDPKSRYYSLATAQATLPDGRTVTYVRRRFLPQGNEMALLGELTVNRDDRLDLITANTLGDPEQFWRICDANNAMHPADLTAISGQVLRIPLPQV